MSDISSHLEPYDNAMDIVPEGVMRRLRMLAGETDKYRDTYLNMSVETRENFQMDFSATFKEFWHFAIIGMRYLGFDTTWMQIDIAIYMQYGGLKTLIMAQRGEAKTTLAALFAIWSLIHNPTTRVLIVSGDSDQSSDISGLIVKLITQWNLLCWLRGDPKMKDRSSSESYDVHYALRGIDKSASISCTSIISSLQGKRADLLIPDDIETQKNSLTDTEREKIKLFSKEFASIVATEFGRIMYLGTPQTEKSIYRDLPNQGFNVRTWFGRYPNKETFERYNLNHIAPSLLKHIEDDPTLLLGGYGIDGTMGKRTDPARYSEDEMLSKELVYGAAGFYLQFMLDTTLSDAERSRLKLSDFIVGDYSSDEVPERIFYAAERRVEIPKSELPSWYNVYKMYNAAAISDTAFVQLDAKVLKVDPAGSGGDEVGYAALGATKGYIHLLTVGGIRGGLCEENLDHIIDEAVDLGITNISVEKNMGHGTAAMVFTQRIKERSSDEPHLRAMGVSEYYVTGQKEKRIIDALSPVMRKHKLIVHQRAIDNDKACSLKHNLEKQAFSSFFYQVASITNDRGSLAMDDRIDAVASGVMELNAILAYDDAKAAEKREEIKAQEFVDNPMGYSADVLRRFNPQTKRGRVRRR